MNNDFQNQNTQHIDTEHTVTQYHTSKIIYTGLYNLVDYAYCRHAECRGAKFWVFRFILQYNFFRGNLNLTSWNLVLNFEILN